MVENRPKEALGSLVETIDTASASKNTEFQSTLSCTQVRM